MSKETLNPIEEQQQFDDSLRTIQQTLEQYGVNYALVGGLALKGLFNEPVAPRRPNKTVIDFDAIGLGPNDQTIEVAMAELTQLKAGKVVYPDIGIESAVFNDSSPSLSLKDFFTTVLSSLRVDSQGKYFLNYRKIETEVPPETMQLQTVRLNGVPFPTLPAKTLWFRYLVRGGVLKMKDDEKLDKLQRYIIDHNDQQPPDELYTPYLEFAMKIHEQYKIPLGIYEGWWALDRRLGNLLSGNPLLYKAIGLLHK